MLQATTEPRHHNFRRTARKLGPSAEQIATALAEKGVAEAAEEAAAQALASAKGLRADAISWQDNMVGFARLTPGRYRWRETGDELVVTDADHAKHLLDLENARRLTARRSSEYAAAVEAARSANAVARIAHANAIRIARLAVTTVIARLATRRVVVRVRSAANTRSRRTRVVRAIAAKTSSTGDPESEPSPLALAGEAGDSHDKCIAGVDAGQVGGS